VPARAPAALGAGAALDAAAVRGGCSLPLHPLYRVHPLLLGVCGSGRGRGGARGCVRLGGWAAGACCCCRQPAPPLAHRLGATCCVSEPSPHPWRPLSAR
jgi:hypothetical protein